MSLKNKGFKINERDQAVRIEKLTVRDRGAIKLIQVKDILKICFEEGLCFIYTDETFNHRLDKMKEYYRYYDKIEYQHPTYLIVAERR